MPERQVLDNGAHVVRRDEIARLRIDRTPLKALVARTQSGTARVPMTIILTASSRPEDPDYGFAYVQGQPGNTIRWRLRAGTDNERWIEGSFV